MHTKYTILLLLSFISSITLKAQFSFHSDKPYPRITIINGYTTDSVSIHQLQPKDIHHATLQSTYDYPFGALYIQTHQFVTFQRPDFYLKLQEWLTTRSGKNFVVDGKPLLKKKDLLTVKENDIEGFSFLSDNGREIVEIILALDFGINYR